MFFFEALFVLDISFKNKLTPQKGRVLLADPFLADEYFQRSVVYLCEHSKAGSFGFVLNNYVDISINELNPNFPSLKVKLSLGGPVETESLYFLHTLGHELNESLELKNDYVLQTGAKILMMGDDWLGEFDWVSCDVLYMERTPNISTTLLKTIRNMTPNEV